MPLVETARIQEVFATATARYEAARAFYNDAAATLWADVSASDGGGDPALRARTRPRRT